MIILRDPSLIHRIADPSIRALVSHRFSQILSGDVVQKTRTLQLREN